MFVQVIEGRVKDAEGVRRQWQRWLDELRPGADGFLGTTAGVTDDGRFVAVARFESEEAARRNSGRPEQGAWWEETSELFEGEVSFTDSAEVDQFLDGGSDDAGFVQVMRGRADRTALRSLLDELEPTLRQERPEVFGGITAWSGDRFVEIVYFRSEAEAREGEKRMSEGREAAGARFQEVVSDLTYLDLRQPLLA